MKRHARSLWSVLVVMLVIALLLAACGPGEVLPTMTPMPSATATPRSIPLPEVLTAIPLASEDRPLTILMLPQGARRAAATANEDLATLIQELTGLTVEVQLVNTYGEIVVQLCGSTPVVGWLDGPALIVAEAQGCADPALLVERGGATGYQVEMVMNTRHVGNEPDPEDVAQMADETLCRVVGDAAADWQIVELLLRTGGVNPLTDLDEIIDVEDYDALVTAVYENECAGGVLPAGTYPRELGAELRAIEDLQEDVALITTSPEIPYDSLVYPQTVPLNVRIPLTDIFMQISVDEENAATLSSILEQDRLQRVDGADFAEFRAFMAATGLDFAALGD
ncbi:phosphate/phosphite/phosphonate ABC transporter substrate-binding protein [Chloroflexota bacterium]